MTIKNKIDWLPLREPSELEKKMADYMDNFWKNVTDILAIPKELIIQDIHDFKYRM